MHPLLSSGCAVAAVALGSAGCTTGTGAPAAAPATVHRAMAAPPAPECRLPPARWAWYRDFWFDPARAEIRPSDAEKIDEVVALLHRQPALCVAIDGTTRERASDLGRLRIANLRGALVRAGIGPDRILTGDVGNPGLRHAQRVELLIGPPP